MTPTTSLSERIADGIVGLIRDHGLRPGDALMSSRDLAGRFDVTVPTVREALRRLEAIDAIRFRHGSGTYVGDGITRHFWVNPHVGGSDLASVLELVEARLLVEPGVAGAAAERRTAEQLAALDAATRNALVPQQADERPELHFHVALAQASGNRLLGETVEALLTVRARDQVEIRHRYNDRGRDHEEHREILTAVRDRDAQAAEDLTRRHLTSIRDALVTDGSASVDAAGTTAEVVA